MNGNNTYKFMNLQNLKKILQSLNVILIESLKDQKTSFSVTCVSKGKFFKKGAASGGVGHSTLFSFL